MLDSNDRDQEPSAAQHHENDGCPACGEPIQAITRRGPTDATASPCGCDVTDLPLRDLEEVTA